MAPYPIEALIGDLPDPYTQPQPQHRGADGRSTTQIRTNGSARPSTSRRWPGSRCPRGGLVRCPASWHADVHPSCSVGTDATQGWKCHGGSCGVGGAIYDLASVLLGGPWGRELRGEQFKRARAYVADMFGELT